MKHNGGKTPFWFLIAALAGTAVPGANTLDFPVTAIEQYIAEAMKKGNIEG